MSRAAGGQSGEIRIRSLLEILLLLVVAYVVVHVAPVIVHRMNFVNALEVAAHAPVEESASVIRRKVLEIAESYSIALRTEHLHVERDRERNRTVIDVTYELYVNFWPSHTYVWTVHDRVEAVTL